MRIKEKNDEEIKKNEHKLFNLFANGFEVCSTRQNERTKKRERQREWEKGDIQKNFM